MPIIQTEKVPVKWYNLTKNHYIKKGYVFTKYRDIFFVDYHDLIKNSLYRVKCKCDYCGKEFSGTYRAVHTNKFVCCDNEECKKKRLQDKLNEKQKEKLYMPSKRVIPTTKMQRYYGELLHGTLNEVIGNYTVDILINDVYVDCDFYGEFVNSKISHDIYLELLKDMKEKDSYLESRGYRGIHLINNGPDFPPDSKVISVVQKFIESDRQARIVHLEDLL